MGYFGQSFAEVKSSKVEYDIDILHIFREFDLKTEQTRHFIINMINILSQRIICSGLFHYETKKAGVLSSRRLIVCW